jgi:hypothetical protein
MTTATSPADALAERLFGATLGALELLSVHHGAELGLYRAFVQNGPQTADELARAAGIAPRYTHEWLQQQAVAGLLEVDDPRAPAEVRRYGFAAEHARVLTAPGDEVEHMMFGWGVPSRRPRRRRVRPAAACASRSSVPAPATTPRESISLPTASSSSPAAAAAAHRPTTAKGPTARPSAPRNDHGGDLSWPSR